MTLAEFAATPQGWVLLLTGVIGAVQLLSLWGWWSMRKAFVTSKACAECRTACRKEVDARLGKQESSAGELHDKVSQAAPAAELAKAATADEALRGDIKALTATIEGLQEQQRALARQVGLLMQHHLGGGR